MVNSERKEAVKAIKRSSEIISDTSKEIKSQEKVKVQYFINAFEERAFGFLILIFCLPSCFPGLLPPLPSILAVPLAIISYQLMMDFPKPKLPKFIVNFSFKSKSISTVLDKSIWLFQKLEKAIKPRIPEVVDGFSERFMGFFLLVLSLSVAIPLPFTNFLPSVAMVFFALAIIEREGLFAIIGYIIGVIGIIVAISAVRLVIWGVGKGLEEMSLITLLSTSLS